MNYILILNSIVAGVMCILTAFLALPSDVEITQRMLYTILAGGLLQALKDISSYLSNPNK